MSTVQVLQLQLNGSFNLLMELIDSMSDADWGSRAVPGTSKPGFTVWHGARIIDWGVHCAIQGVPELADRPEWAQLRGRELAYGAGITEAEADGVPESISPQQVRAYLSALKPVALGWLDRQSDAELDAIPSFQVHQQSNPRYLSPSVWAEVETLDGIPAWQILARPCVSHIRVHAGEVRTLLQMMRAVRASPA